MDFASHCWI